MPGGLHVGLVFHAMCSELRIHFMIQELRNVGVKTAFRHINLGCGFTYFSRSSFTFFLERLLTRGLTRPNNT